MFVLVSAGDRVRCRLETQIQRRLALSVGVRIAADHAHDRWAAPLPHDVGSTIIPARRHPPAAAWAPGRSGVYDAEDRLHTAGICIARASHAVCPSKGDRDGVCLQRQPGSPNDPT